MILQNQISNFYFFDQLLICFNFDLLSLQKETRCWTCGREENRGDWCGQGVGVFNTTCPRNNMTCYKEIWVLDKQTRKNKYLYNMKV